jgi:LPS-assembly protein
LEGKIRPHSPAGSSRALALLAGAAAAALLAGEAQAQSRDLLDSPISTAPSTPTPQAAPRPDDGLGPRDVYIEADTLIDDRDAKVVTADGSVEARYQGRTIRADKLVYNTDTGAAHATGHAVIVNPDGTVEYGDDIELDDQLRAGVALGFAARLQDNVTIAAAAAIKRGENVNELNSAIYTACEICKQDGSPKEPTWSVKADKIIQDREHRVIYYKNAVIKVLGVPVLYIPVFWHADPTADRKSGLLTPRLSYNERRGLTYEQPFLWAISKYSDLVVTPQFSTKVNPFLELEYRKRFYSGQVSGRIGYTYEKNFDSEGRFGDSTSRSFILATGQFKPADKWAWGFGAERVSDPTLFVRYRISDLYVDRGPFTTDTLRLISQVWARRQDDNSYVSVAAMGFQSLRVAQVNRTIVTDDNEGAFPVVAPLVESRYNLPQQILGGRLRVRGSAVMLSRNELVANPMTFGAGYLSLASSLTPSTSYLRFTDSRRISGTVDWRGAYTFGPGLRVEPFVVARGDFYWVTDPRYVTLNDQGGVASSEKAEPTVTRAVGVTGADLSWPLIKPVGSASIILEPLIQVAISPTFKTRRSIPNEDSLSFDFDTTNLFSVDRFPGYDLYEGGVRFNVGGRASVNWSGGRHAIFALGRVIRTETNPSFTTQSGLRGRYSDWVTALEVTPINGVSLFSRARLDSDTLAVRREEAGFNLNVKRGYVGMRYLYNGQDALNLKTQTIQAAGQYFFTKNWGFGFNASRDLQQDVWPQTQLSLLFQNDCIQLALIWTHDETYDRKIAPSNTIGIRLNLTTLGNKMGFR